MADGGVSVISALIVAVIAKIEKFVTRKFHAAKNFENKLMELKGHMEATRAILNRLIPTDPLTGNWLTACREAVYEAEEFMNCLEGRFGNSTSSTVQNLFVITRRTFGDRDLKRLEKLIAKFEIIKEHREVYINLQSQNHGSQWGTYIAFGVGVVITFVVTVVGALVRSDRS